MDWKWMIERGAGVTFTVISAPTRLLPPTPLPRPPLNTHTNPMTLKVSIVPRGVCLFAIKGRSWLRKYIFFGNQANITSECLIFVSAQDEERGAFLPNFQMRLIWKLFTRFLISARSVSLSLVKKKEQRGVLTGNDDQSSSSTNREINPTSARIKARTYCKQICWSETISLLNPGNVSWHSWLSGWFSTHTRQSGSYLHSERKSCWPDISKR